MIILDTNVIMAFLLSNGITRRIIVEGAAEFTSSEYCFEELWRHRNVWNKKKLSEIELQNIVDDVKQYFVPEIPDNLYYQKIPISKTLCPDVDDAPVLASALSVVNEGLWTYNLKHFKLPQIEERVPILTTSEVLTMYPLKRE